MRIVLWACDRFLHKRNIICRLNHTIIASRKELFSTARFSMPRKLPHTTKARQNKHHFGKYTDRGTRSSIGRRAIHLEIRAYDDASILSLQESNVNQS